ncbi:hypothetical protein [Kitasatospora sp. NPDC050463]|uniref:hypothetical protein n=1 Tax=Kitasatospora sp. NPDC050463 TaxID=3155786 RepID=UPI0033C2CF0D
MLISGKSLKRPAAVLAAAAAISGGLAVAPASAAPATAGTSISSVPSCVSYSTSSSWVTNTARATNNCSYSVRLRFNWSNHTDGPCTTISGYGGWHSETVAITASFQGAYSC